MCQIIKKYNLQYFWIQTLLWAAAVVNYAYMTQILQAKGFTEVEIGILNGCKLLVGVFFQIWIGRMADRTRYILPLKYVVALLAVMAAFLTIGLHLTGHSFLPMLLISAGFGISFTTLQPLIDSISILYNSHGMSVDYAKCRMGGSISWAILCVLTGLYCDSFGTKYLPIFGLVLVIILAVAVAKLPWEDITQSKIRPEEQGESPHSVLYLLKNCKTFDLFLLGSAVMFMGYNLGSVFLIDIFRGLGGGNIHYGCAEFVLAIAEVPSAFIIVAMRKHIPVKWIMICCAFFMTLKNLIPTYTADIWVVIAAQACEMLGLGLYYAGSIYFVEESLSGADVVKGMTLISVFTVGCGEGIASLFCGMIRKKMGLYGLMKVGTIVNGISVLIFLSMFLVKEKGRGDKELVNIR